MEQILSWRIPHTQPGKFKSVLSEVSSSKKIYTLLISTLLQLAMFNEDEDVFGLLVDAIADKYPGKKSKAQLAKV